MKKKTDRCSVCIEPMWPAPDGAKVRVCRPCRRSIKTRPCAQCGVEFYNRDLSIRACSRGCGQKLRVRVARGRDPEKARIRDAVKRARRKAAFVERVSPSVVFERDGWRCHLCGGRCLPDGNDPMGATMDHIVPLALGGPHSYANIATAHRICNVRKGTKAMGEQLALV